MSNHTNGQWLINDEGWRSQIVAIGSDRTIAEDWFPVEPGA